MDNATFGLPATKKNAIYDTLTNTPPSSFTAEGGKGLVTSAVLSDSCQKVMCIILHGADVGSLKSLFVLLRTVGLRAFSMASETYTSGTHCAAFVTCPNDSVATNLARGIVEQKLAACVNIVPAIKSVYEWQGKIEEDNEVLLMIKTRSSKVPALAEYVRSNHPYEVAEVISLPIDQGNPPYLKWIGDIVPE
ncbi:uncharacterized protein V6R79_005879 [Siganus canaliculatus]